MHAPGGHSAGVGDIGRVRDVDGPVVAESILVVGQGEGLREAAAEDGAVGELVGVAVAPGRAGNFGEGAVGDGAVFGVREGGVEGADGGYPAPVACCLGLWTC